jgi:hypothetical protein
VDLVVELETRLALTEGNVEQMRRQFRSLPPDHPERGALLRQLEIAATVAGELESLLGLVGRERRTFALCVGRIVDKCMADQMTVIPRR